MSSMVVDKQTVEIPVTERRPALVGATRAGLLALIVAWLAFQILAIRAPFPPIGIMYAVGYGVGVWAISRRKRWGIGFAVGVTSLIQLVESPLTVGHLLNWNDIYTHFDHYLLLGVFLPFSALTVATGVAAMRRTGAQTTGAAAPAWLRVAVIATAVSIVLSEIIVIALYELQIP
jgi:hypothetical protein